MRFGYGIFGGFSISFLLWCGAVAGTLNKGASDVSLALDAYFQIKQNAALQYPSPRLFILGGSSSFYGVSAAELFSRTGLPTINFASHGGLQLRIMTAYLKPLLRSGDTVLIAPEYQYYQSTGLGPEAVDYILSGDPSMLRKLPPRDGLQILMGVTLFERLKHTIGFSKEDDLRREAGAKQRAKFQTNELGDYAGHGQANVDADVKVNGEPLPIFLQHPSEAKYPGWEELDLFRVWCHQHNVKLIATFPALLTNDQYFSPTGKAVSNRLVQDWRDRGVPVLGTPLSNLFPRDDIYDTEYHLNEEAMIKRSSLLASDLAAVLGLEPVGKIELEKPPAQPVAFSGFHRASGLRPEEGPYDGIPYERFRFADFPTVSLDFKSEGGPMVMEIAISPIGPTQNLIVNVNNHEIASFLLKFGHTQPILTPSFLTRTGENRLTLEFSEPFGDPGNNRTLSAYVASIRLSPRPLLTPVLPAP